MRILTAVVVGLFGAAVVSADAAGSDEMILPEDPRFDVFEEAKSEGYGTVLLSFVTRDSRYCRAARIPADSNVVLACRGNHGWKIEATSGFDAARAPQLGNSGGEPMAEINRAIEVLRAGPDFLDGPGVQEAAAKGWRDPDPVDEQSFDAGDILKRTAQVYRASRSYMDTGTVRTVYPTHTGETHFKTAWQAPHDFRFESTMHDFGSVEVRYIAWMNQDGFATWFSLKPGREEVVSSIQGALDEAAGISRDASGIIPGLIVPGNRLGGDIVRLTSAVRLEDAEINGFDCFQVQGFRWPNNGETTTVWIDKESYLIRRVYEERTIQGDTTKTTWSYQPMLNQPIAAELLRFDKPDSPAAETQQ